MLHKKLKCRSPIRALPLQDVTCAERRGKLTETTIQQKHGDNGRDGRFWVDGGGEQHVRSGGGKRFVLTDCKGNGEKRGRRREWQHFSALTRRSSDFCFLDTTWEKMFCSGYVLRTSCQSCEKRMMSFFSHSSGTEIMYRTAISQLLLYWLCCCMWFAAVRKRITRICRSHF